MRYLDHNASVPVKPAVAEAVAEALTIAGNAASVHAAGRRARAAIEEARARVARLVGARTDQVVFTSGGTEANNLALRGVVGLAHRMASAVEHPSVLKAAEAIEIVPCDGDGVVIPGRLADALERAPGPALVSIMAANNETGVVQPIRELAAVARRHGALVHCDAVQMAGRLPFDMTELGVDLVTLSAHKIGGPQGAGALVIGDRVRGIEPIARGGGQERGLRAGTEALAAIVGFGVAARLAAEDRAAAPRIAALRDRLEAGIRRLAPTARIVGEGALRLPNTTCVTMPGVPSETQVIGFDLDGFAVSAGAACSSGRVEPSHVLAAMGLPGSEAASAIRVSLGWTTSEGDITSFVAAWAALYGRLGRTRAAA
jgi:cysteine desulfurase